MPFRSILLLAIVATACLSVAPGAYAACASNPMAVTNGTLDVPGATLQFFGNTTGTRDYDCSSGMPVATGNATANFTGGGYTGYFYYNATGYPIWQLTSAKGTRSIVSASPSTFSFEPSPTGALSWLRGPFLSDTGSPPVAYLTRTNTTGGVLASCPPGEKGIIKVPYTAIYSFYSC